MLYNSFKSSICTHLVCTFYTKSRQVEARKKYKNSRESADIFRESEKKNTPTAYKYNRSRTTHHGVRRNHKLATFFMSNICSDIFSMIFSLFLGYMFHRKSYMPEDYIATLFFLFPLTTDVHVFKNC